LESYIGLALIYWFMCIIIEKSIALYEYRHSIKSNKEIEYNKC